MKFKHNHIWFPMLHQVFFHARHTRGERDKFTYLRSVWIGFTAPILNLPGAVIKILIGSDNRLTMLLKLLFVVITFPLLGLFGWLYGLNVKPEFAMELRRDGF